MHVFVDESQRQEFMLCAAIYKSGDLLRARRVLRQLCKPGQRRVHMAKERDPRRKEILAVLETTGVTARLYTSSGPLVQARAACLRNMMVDLDNIQVMRLVLESVHFTQDRRDRRIIAEHRQASSRELIYEHLGSHQELLLCVADAIAWAYGAGGDWRRRVDPMIEKIVAN